MDGDHPKSVAEEISGLRNGILAVALFVLHKAANVMGCAQVHVARGLCSWSLSSAYQAAFFGMKAILQLLGVVVIETGDQSYLVDVWAEPDKKKKKNFLGPKYPVLIQKVQRVEHRHLWGCFQRMLRVCTAPADIWPVGCVQSLKDLDINGFARQRNKLHYTTLFWPFEDLHACNVIADFGRHPEQHWMTVRPFPTQGTQTSQSPWGWYSSAWAARWCVTSRARSRPSGPNGNCCGPGWPGTATNSTKPPTPPSRTLAPP